MPIVTVPSSSAGVLNYTDQPAASVSGLDNVVQVLHRFAPSGSGGLGEEITTLTVVVSNRNQVPQQTFGPATITAATPEWLQEHVNTPADTAYLLNLVVDTTNYSYPADHVILRLSAVAVSGNTYEIDLVVPFSSSSGLTEPAGRESYADVSFAHEFFATRLEGTIWEQYDERDQQRALLTASDDLDKEAYKGEKLFYNTPYLSTDTEVVKWGYRQFPRLIPEFSFLHHLESVELDTIPQAIKEGTCMQALWLLETFKAGQDLNTRRNLQAFGATGHTTQGSTENWDLARQSHTRICQAAMDHIRPYVINALDVGYFG